MNNNLLSFLGLALRGGRLVAGEEPAASAAQGEKARLLLAASDASGNTTRRAERLAEAGHCMYLTLPFTKEELGGALGRSSVAIAAVTDLGMASALVRRLAAMDAERYGDAAARMELKVRRAAERKTAPPRGKQPPRRPGGPEGRGAESHETDRRRFKPKPGDQKRTFRPGEKPDGKVRSEEKPGGKTRPGEKSGGKARFGERPNGKARFGEKPGGSRSSGGGWEKRPHGGPLPRRAGGRPQAQRRSHPGKPDRGRGGGH